MAVKKKKAPSHEQSLWEQLIDRINTATLPDSNIERNRFELLELLSQSIINTPQFFARLGTILSHSVYADAIIIYEQTNDQIRTIFSNMPKKQEQQLMSSPSVRNRLNRAKKPVQTDKINEKIQVNRQERTIDRITRVILDHSPKSEISMAVFSDESLLKVDIKFLTFINAMMNIRRRQHQMGKALTSEAGRLTTLTHHLSEGLIILDRDLKITLWNRPLQRLTGYSPRDAENKPYSQVFKRLSYPNWLTEIRNEYDNDPLKNVFYADFEIATKQKSRSWVSVSGSFLRSADSSIDQTVMIVRDISKSKELENLKSEFISIATHELRTPITAIKGYLSMLEGESKKLSGKQKLYLSRAVEANNRLVGLVEELLQVIRIEENRLQFSIRAVNVYPVIEKVLLDFSVKAKRKCLETKIIPTDFPTTIMVDPVKFEQVIANLVDNALKYTKCGRIEISFSQVYDRNTRETLLAIHVKDTGTGISEADQKQIFEKFIRTANARTGTESGAGLGLFIVKSFIEKQGGKITVRSRLNHGSTFTVLFPIIEERKSKADPEEKSILERLTASSNLGKINWKGKK